MDFSAGITALQKELFMNEEKALDVATIFLFDKVKKYCSGPLLRPEHTGPPGGTVPIPSRTFQLVDSLTHEKVDKDTRAILSRGSIAKHNRFVHDGVMRRKKDGSMWVMPPRRFITETFNRNEKEVMTILSRNIIPKSMR